MNPDIEELFQNIQEPTGPIDDENEYLFRRDVAQKYLSYEETIFTGERSKQDSLKKIHDYAKIWGVSNALNTLIEWELPEPAQGDYGCIVDEDEEPDMVTGENRNKVLEMFNVLVDELLAQELTDHDLEMVAMCIWNTIHGDIA